MPGWQVLSSKEVYKTPWIRIRRDEVLNQNAKPLTYNVIELINPSVFIIAVDKDGNILMQQCYRYTIDKTIWEIPAGNSDGEDILKAAKRELLEETGYTSDGWTHLGRLYQVVGVGNMPFEIFFADNVQQQSDKLDKEEDILHNRFMTIKEIEKLVLRGGFDDAPVLAALYLAKIHGLIKD